MPIARIADLPITEHPPLDLLALTEERLAPDVDYAGFGWTWIDSLELSAPARPSVVIPRALVLALHSAEVDNDPDAHDIELEFDVDGALFRAPLSRVLEVHLPRLPGAADVVLALCNPEDIVVRAPVGAVGRIHYALGDVTSWLDRDQGGGERIRLAAKRWSIATPDENRR
jgi:hypothetical protein